MKREHAIDGVICTPLRQIEDRQGTLLHMLRCDESGFSRFGEVYFSEVLPGVMKAWKRHKLQTQNFVVPTGRIRVAIFDARENSPTHGFIEHFDMGRPSAYFRLTIPPLLHYGFQCLGDAPALLANCTDLPHDPAEGEMISEEAAAARFPAATRSATGK
jgi:dTDP-4-dehydrorhamnose 3,5-epimerase